MNQFNSPDINWMSRQANAEEASFTMSNSSEKEATLPAFQCFFKVKDPVDEETDGHSQRPSINIDWRKEYD